VFEQYEDQRPSQDLELSRQLSWTWNEKLALWKSA